MAEMHAIVIAHGEYAAPSGLGMLCRPRTSSMAKVDNYTANSPAARPAALTTAQLEPQNTRLFWGPTLPPSSL